MCQIFPYTSPKEISQKDFLKDVIAFLKIYLFQVKDGLDLNLEAFLIQSRGKFQGHVFWLYQSSNIAPVPPHHPEKMQCYEETELIHQV